MADPPVVNASPLIFLAGAGFLDFLQLIAETMVMPAFVADEIHSSGLSDVTAQALQDTARIIRIEDPAIPSIIQSWDLGEGESAGSRLGIGTAWHGGYYRRFGRPTLCSGT